MARIVILVNDSLTHDSRLFKQAKHLHKQGHEVLVFGNQPPGAGMELNFQRDGCQYYRPAKYPRWSFYRRSSWNLQAARFIIRHRPDIIINHRYNTLIPAMLGSWRKNTPIIFDNRELFGGGNFDKKSWLYKNLFWAFESIFSRVADEIIMSSHGRAQVWAQKYKRAKPLVLYDCAEWRKVEPSDVLRREYNWDASVKLIMYIGSMDSGRGLVPAVESLALLPKNYVLVAMGYGSDMFLKQLQQRATELGVQDRFFLHPPVPPEQIPVYASSADVTLCNTQNVSMSYYHSVPQKFYESLQAGVPVLSNDFPEQASLVRKFNVGLCVDPEDIKKVAQAIVEIVDGPTLREVWRQRCLQAADVMTWENEVKVLLDSVSRLLAN